MKPDRVPRALSRDNALAHGVLAAYRAAVRRYAGKPWVTGVSISMRERDGDLLAEEGPVIAIHVRRKVRRRERVPKSQRIPTRILGIPTDVIEGDYRWRHGSAPVPIATDSELRPGHSIARSDGSAGTFGAVVMHDTGRCLLTAAHVLREGGRGRRGDRIVHPGPADAHHAAPRPVARYATVHLGMDAGLATLEDGVTASNLALVTGVAIGAPAVAEIGDIVEKVGRSTQVTQAVVQGLGTFLDLWPAMHLRPVAGDLDPEPLSERGDSGAVWYRLRDGAAIGLHCAGSGATAAGLEYGVATMLPWVLQGLRASWPEDTA